MKLSTSVIAALLGLGSLARGRPQQIGQDSTPPEELSSSGSDAIASSGGDDSAEGNFPYTIGYSPNDVNFIDSNDPNNNEELLAVNSVQINPTYSDETGTLNDQLFDVAPSENLVRVTAEAALGQVQNGKAAYVIYKVRTLGNVQGGIDVLKVVPLNPEITQDQQSKQCIDDMKRYVKGYLVYYTQKGPVPVFFAIKPTGTTDEIITTMFGTFAVFNEDNHLDPDILIINQEEDFQEFLNKIRA